MTHMVYRIDPRDDVEGDDACHVVHKAFSADEAETVRAELAEAYRFGREAAAQRKLRVLLADPGEHKKTTREWLRGYDDERSGRPPLTYTTD